MEKDKQINGAVSLWIGNAPSRAELEEYVEIDYTTGGMSHLSKLADDFGTGFYDEDFMDTTFHEVGTRSLPLLLHRCSYAELIIPKIVERCGEVLPMETNSAVLLYDFLHEDTSKPALDVGGRVKLRFMGSITVDSPWPD